MTSETSVKMETCKTCGADVRPGSMFCYNCGSAVAPELPPAGGLEKNESAKLGSPATNDQISKPTAKSEIAEPISKSAVEQITASDESLKSESPATKIKQPAAEKEVVLQTAAAVRRQPRPPAKRVEVVWEEENSSNALFIIAAVVLAVFAGAVLIAMLYLR